MAVAFFYARFDVAFSESTPCASVRGLHNPPSRQFRHFIGSYFFLMVSIFDNRRYIPVGNGIRLCKTFLKIHTKTKKTARRMQSPFWGVCGVDSKKATPKCA
jgi:hypothetical protein